MSPSHKNSSVSYLRVFGRMKAGAIKGKGYTQSQEEKCVIKSPFEVHDVNAQRSTWNISATESWIKVLLM